MIVKVRNASINSKEEPIQLIFENDLEKEKISFIGDRIVYHPENMDEKEAEDFLKNENGDIEYKEKWLRAMAEIENYKKRSAREKEDLKDQIKLETLNSIIEIENDLSIAISSLSETQSEGVKIIKDKLNLNLKKLGLTEVDTTEYNPDTHEVISIFETGKGEKIINVVSKGWIYNNKIIKYPKVVLEK